MEALPNIWSLTPVGLVCGVLALLVIALVRGWFIPKASHEREMGLANERGNDWKKTAERLEAVNQEIRRQNGSLIEATKTSSKFFADVTPSIEDTGDHHVGT